MKTQPSKLFFKIKNPYVAAPGGKKSIATYLGLSMSETERLLKFI